MRRTPREQAAYILSILAGAAPFVVGFFRAFGRHHDFRFLWMACVAFAGAMLGLVLARSRRRASGAMLVLALLTIVFATVPAAFTGFFLGARAAAGVWMVAVVYGITFAARNVLAALSRPRER